MASSPPPAWAASFDPFEALGLQRDANADSIRARYRDLARRYHPNRNQGSAASHASLAEHFHQVHSAWQHLEHPDKRRRCIERLDLDDQREAVHAAAGDLSSGEESDHSEAPHGEGEGHVSSDADDDDDLPRVAGIKRRATFDKLPKGEKVLGKSLGNIAEEPGSEARSPRSRWQGTKNAVLSRAPRAQKKPQLNGAPKEENTTALRRKQFDQLRRKEREAFEAYWEAMMEKFEAEQAAERYREEFERAKWRREYFERAPRDASDRVKLLKLFNNATKAFSSQQPVRPRNRSSVSYAGQMLSTGDPFEKNQNQNQLLKLPSRNKSAHKRGWSSDMTADQTSSSEEQESSEKAVSRSRSPHPRPSARPNHLSHQRWASLPNIVPTSPRNIPNGQWDEMSPITGPGPKVLVRQPTGLGEMLAQGSDADSASASVSSRSASPQPLDEDTGKFTMVSTRNTPDLLDDGHNRRSRSPASNRRSLPPATNGARPTSRPPSEPRHFQIKQIGRSQFQNIPMANVHELSYTQKESILGVDPDADTDPEELLHRLAQLDEGVATKFIVKPDIKASFRFRLVHDRAYIARRQSFIALSYRRKLHVEKNDDHYTLPLEREMFQAVWDERVSPEEGVWIDQVCIDGESESEKTISMSAMDMVYRSARLVVVALDDIQFDAAEASALEKHMEEFDHQTNVPANKRFRRKQTPYLESHYDLYKVIRKMLSSSWFRRAWCRHEMRLAREHIFLVPVDAPGGKSVMRFTGRCLTHLLGLSCEVPFAREIEAVKPALYAFFRDRSKLPAHHEDHDRSHHGNFTTVVAEVFGMEAGGDPRIPEEQRAADARKDKIAIILNTMECGLALQPILRATRFSLPTPECYYMLMLLALAARDPGALCAVGHPLHDLPLAVTSTWLFEPTNVDAGLNNYRTLPRLPPTPITTHTAADSHYVRLDLHPLTHPTTNPPQPSTNLPLAYRLLTHSATHKLGRNRARYLLHDKTATHLFGPMPALYAATLAAILDLGSDWLAAICPRHGVSRWDHDLAPALNLLIALRNTCGRWPEAAWEGRAVGFLADVVNFVVVRGLPQRQIGRFEVWVPRAFEMRGGGRGLTFLPEGVGEGVRGVVPVALGGEAYVHLARVWVVRPREGGDGDGELRGWGGEWSLLGKSVLFGDEAAVAELEQGVGEAVRCGQAVFGRGLSRATRAVHQFLHP